MTYFELGDPPVNGCGCGAFDGPDHVGGTIGTGGAATGLGCAAGDDAGAVAMFGTVAVDVAGPVDASGVVGTALGDGVDTGDGVGVLVTGTSELLTLCSVACTGACSDATAAPTTLAPSIAPQNRTVPPAAVRMPKSQERDLLERELLIGAT